MALSLSSLNLRLALPTLVEHLRASFWAIPMAGLLLAAVLSVGNHALDQHLFESLASEGPVWLRVSDQEANRQLFATVASASLGVLGLTFSVTITSLVLASQQFGPRLLRTYMQKRFVQYTLAAFAGSSLYSFISLYLSSAVRQLEFVPVISVGSLLLIVVLDLVLLVIFIHRTAASLQVDAIIADVYEDLKLRVDAMYPARQADSAGHAGQRDARVLERAFAGATLMLRSEHSGYLQAVEEQELADIASDHGCSFRLCVTPGDYLLSGSCWLEVAEFDGDEESLAASASECLVIGEAPTPQQDIRYEIRQLVEIALRALSPGINDPFTAMSCLDRLSSILSLLLARPSRTGQIQSEKGRLLLVNRFPDHADLIADSFNQIRQQGIDRVDVSLHLMRKLAALLEQDAAAKGREALKMQLDRLHEGLEKQNFVSADRAILLKYLAILDERFDQRPDQSTAEPRRKRTSTSPC